MSEKSREQGHKDGLAQGKFEKGSGAINTFIDSIFNDSYKGQSGDKDYKDGYNQGKHDAYKK